MRAPPSIEHVELEEIPVAKHPEPRPEPRPDGVDTPVPNRRERRGGKSEAPLPRGEKSAVGRNRGMAPNRRQYSTRRRGG
ncbi:MAG: hypothetical protein GEV09_05405 [Pseudonocardiaceae bacterium]|nr:hypothetical protein [Pseudonocardiaceae bacterium]